MNQHENSVRDKIVRHLKDNWYVFVFIVPIAWALITDHFIIKALAADLTKLDIKVTQQIQKQELLQKEINDQLTKQAKVNGSNTAILEVIAQQNRTIQGQLWDLKNGHGESE